MRLIDADALLQHKGDCYDADGHILYAVGTGSIIAAPTINAVQVVRCFECEHWEPSNAEEGDYSGHCRCPYGMCESAATDATWFCSDGTMKEEDDV